MNVIFMNKIVCNHPPHLYIAYKGNVLSTYDVCTNFAGLGSTYAVTVGLAVKYR